MSGEFRIISEEEHRLITAVVGIVSPVDCIDGFVAVKNIRGWDIPGGHVNLGEKAEQAFRRELREEANAEVVEADSVLILDSLSVVGTGILVMRATCTLGSFRRTDEILDSAIFTSGELIEHYFGDKRLLGELLKICRKKFY